MKWLSEQEGLIEEKVALRLKDALLNREKEISRKYKQILLQDKARLEQDLQKAYTDKQ
jgi:hypothetical protein